MYPQLEGRGERVAVWVALVFLAKGEVLARGEVGFPQELYQSETPEQQGQRRVVSRWVWFLELELERKGRQNLELDFEWVGEMESWSRLKMP